MFQHEDIDGIVGVKLSRDIMSIAGLALKTNITTLGPLVLPWSEQLLFAIDLVMRKVVKKKGKPYIPDFKLAFEHFCIHTGRSCKCLFIVLLYAGMHVTFVGCNIEMYSKILYYNN